ncbi:MAG: transporter substrate-binding domain-containing protein [Pseudomonadota bacterium]
MNRNDLLRSIAAGGQLRVSINTGNRALVQTDGDELSGVSPALAKRLANELGIPMQPVVYNGAGLASADVDNNTWDVGFLAINKKRAEKASFTRPYIVIEATYAVRAQSSFSELNEVDQDGVSVLTSIGSAYDTYLQANLKHASLERFGTPGESFAAFRAGRCDAVAGIRESLMAHLGDDPNVRLLPGALTSVQQAMVLPGTDNPAIQALDQFVARAIADGFVAAHTGSD